MQEKITLVLATYNSAEMLNLTLKENLQSVFSKIVIVDGESQDKTREVVDVYRQQYPRMIEFYKIPKLGLANARNFGTSKVKTVYTMHAGPDNILSKETLMEMLWLTKKYDLVSCQTALSDINNYLDKAHNYYKKRYMEGVQTVVGTPYLGKTSLFRDFLFNDRMLNSDDTEFCHRLGDHGKMVYRSSDLCYEIGFNDLSNIIERWMRWGRGDALFYREMKRQWSISRRVQSWFHPFDKEVIVPFKALSFPEYIYTFPFLMLTLNLRYLGWLRYIVLNK